MTLVLLVVFIALVFEYINGFHDTANAIATTVSTKVLMPGQAVLLAALFNLVGALAGSAVATTIGKGLVHTEAVTLATLLCALIAGIAWNLLTWWYGLPSSSSHALIGGLCGAALATAHGDWSVIRWAVDNNGKHEGLWYKVVLPMITAPVLGIVCGFAFMGVILFLFARARPDRVNRLFGRLQLLSAAWMSFSHGTNDAQKTMGIIALALFTGTKAGAFVSLPAWAGFLQTPEFKVAIWVKVICAVTMACGTAAGGWKIIRTVGGKMVKMQKCHGFAAQSAAALVIQIASIMGIPLSTTHVISSAIMGVGSTKRLSAVRWGVVEKMLWAWVMTLPITAGLGYMIYRGIHMAGLVAK